MKKLLNKIFFRKTGWSNLVIASLGFFLGLVIILLAFNLYLKFRLIDKQQGNYISINKEVKYGIRDEKGASFTKAEIEELEAQEFVKSVGLYGHAKFQSEIIVEKFGNMRSLLPLESVPDEFIDCELPYQWRRYHKEWDPKAEVVPVVMSREMFNMLNLGFAFSQGLPQVSEKVAMSQQGEFTMWNKKRQKIKYKARIVGFTDRITAILVPESFMNWGNKELMDLDESYTTRVIVETANSSSSEFENFMSERGYAVSIDDLRRQKVMSALFITITIVAILGISFMVLAIALVIAQFSMIILGAKTELQLLLQIGYKRSKIANHFNSILVAYLFIMTLTGLGVFAVVSKYLDQLIGQIMSSLSTGLETEVLILAFGIFIVCSLITIIQLQRALRSKSI